MRGVIRKREKERGEKEMSREGERGGCWEQRKRERGCGEHTLHTYIHTYIHTCMPCDGHGM